VTPFFVKGVPAGGFPELLAGSRVECEYELSFVLLALRIKPLTYVRKRGVALA
jgi:hypothetical protein